MTAFLASVANAQEAQAALEGGVDIIDAKDPRSALGALPQQTIASIVATVARIKPVSAVAGDIAFTPQATSAAIEALIPTGVDIIKLGVFAGHDPRVTIRALSSLARRTKLVAVLFADAGADFSLLDDLAAAGFAGAMLDTMNKARGRLLEHLDIPQLTRFVNECRAAGLWSGLAGSLEAPDAPRLCALAPDFLGFRGALCAGGRADALDAGAVKAIRDLIPRAAPTQASGNVDWRLLAARNFSSHRDTPSETDRVFLRDFIVSMSIGAYSHEIGARQRVRFNVEADVLRTTRTEDAFRDIFSYDIMIDAIRRLTGAGHVALVETLAQGVADATLADPRVKRVRVRVEKLDIVDGSVGVEIERARLRDHQQQPSLQSFVDPARMR
ncbi:MAG: dihydroneopterin aldolase [Hyphomicrobiales bacterium]|nr:dihydroneopterin aldolase [Hyphomicrobiales bacterium]